MDHGNQGVTVADFEYRGRDCDRSAACTNTAVHRRLRNKGGLDGSLVTLNSRPATFHSVDVGAIPYRRMPMDTAIAHAQASILSQSGLRLPVNVVARHREALVSSYALSSSLCVVPRGEEFDWVTKSREVLSALYPELAPSYRKRGLQYYEDRVHTAPEEIASGQFRAVRVVPSDEGYRLAKITVGARNARHLIPHYAVNHYADYLINLLSAGMVELTYAEQGAVRKLITTLNPDMVRKWFGGLCSTEDLKRLSNWRSPFSFCYFHLPDLLNEGQFAFVPLLHIHRVKPYV